MAVSKLLADALKEALKRDYIVKGCAVFATILFPVGEGLMRTFKPQKDAGLWWAFFLSVVFLHLLTVMVTLLKVVDIQRYYFEFTEVEEGLRNAVGKIRALEEQTTNLNHAVVALKNSIDQLQRVLLEFPGKTGLSHEDIDSALDRIFRVFEVEKESVFGYRTAVSLFNMVVYLHESSANELKVFKRWYDPRIPAKNRPWKPPMGHVGYTFATKPGQTGCEVHASCEFLTGVRRNFLLVRPMTFLSKNIHSSGISPVFESVTALHFP